MVTAANGASLKIEPTRSSDRCIDGSVSFAGPMEAGLTAAKLGPRPFTYVVELTLDGVQYEARAQWPHDEERDNEPNVELRFVLPLPAFHVRR